MKDELYRQLLNDGKRYLHHLAFIGATPPKIRDLKLFSVADGTAPENSIKVEGEGFSFEDYASYSYADMGIESFREAGEEESEKPEKKNEKSEDTKEEEEDEKDESGKNDFADSPAMKTARKIFNSAIKSKLDEALKDKLPPAMMGKVHEFADLAVVYRGCQLVAEPRPPRAEVQPHRDEEFLPQPRLLGEDAVVRKDLQPAFGERRRDVVLRGKRVAAGNVHFGSSGREHLAKVCCLGLQMHRQSHPEPLKRLFFRKFILQGPEQRHVLFYPLYLHFPAFPKSGISYFTCHII